MTCVNFYILPDDQQSSLQHYACTLAQTSWQSGKRVLIQTDSAEQSHQLDELLWNIHEDSFVPHGIATLELTDQQQPILITHQKINDANFQHIINLSSRPADVLVADVLAPVLTETTTSATEPASELAAELATVSLNTQAFQIDEILNQNEQRKQSGRSHYKVYRDLGYTLQHHTLETLHG